MSFFKKIGKGIGKVVKTTGKVTGKVLKTAAPVASLVPGVGALASAGASLVGNALSPDKQQSIEDAVEQQGVIKVDKIEQTIAKQNPTLDSDVVQATTKAMINQALSKNPNVEIDDSKSVTSVESSTKLFQWIKSNAVVCVIGIVALFVFLSDKKGARRYRRY